MSDYRERFLTMWYQCGPGSWKYLFVTPSEIQAAQQKSLSPSSRELLAAITHPDTGNVIPLPFRMCAHVPVNSILLLGMLTARSPLLTGVWQSLNQLFNAAQFYANRNASNDVSDARLGASLVGSLFSAVLVSSGLQVLTGKWGMSGRGAAMAIPFLGAAAAKPLQIGLLRGDEYTTGVDVFDENGVCRGKSVIAGREGVLATIFTRVLYLAPMLWIPFCQSWLEARVSILQRNKAARVLSYLSHTALNTALVTPACIAIFDQRATIAAESLEKQFQSKGGVYYYNKGL